MSSLVRFGRRQLHTVVSKEIIKPSSPTPSHLKTYYLSLIDQIAPDVHMPMVAFYPNTENCSSTHAVRMLDLKNSLSQTLTQYYPFSGRLEKTTPTFVECNDDGVEFIEASNDNLLSNFLENMQHEDLDQLFPNDLIWNKLHHSGLNTKNDTRSPLTVQVNSFSCGGIAVAVSLSHKIADGSSLCNFFNDWATMTRLRSWEKSNESPIHPRFISSKNKNLKFQGYLFGKSLDNSVTRSFIFPNSKLNDLKLNVLATTTDFGQPIIDPTRVEVLNWLLFNCAVDASTKNNFGSFQPTGLVHVMNIRNKMIESLPATSIGNLFKFTGFSTKNPNEITPNAFIGQLKKLKMGVKCIKNLRTEIETLSQLSPDIIIEEEQRKLDDYYFFSSLCRYPTYAIDFGWGKPIKATIAGTIKKNSFVAMDRPNDDGIEVLVTLEKQDMEIFQRNTELLSFC